MKRLKDIESKNEQQLDLIKDQGGKPLNLISKINKNKTKAIKFYGEPDEKFKDIVERVNKEKKENEENDDKEFSFTETTAGGKKYDFRKYSRLTKFENKLFKNKISLNEAKDQQNEMLSLIDELKEKIRDNKPGHPYSEENK